MVRSAQTGLRRQPRFGAVARLLAAGSLLALAGAFATASESQVAIADTQTYGAIVGKTYRNNWGGNCPPLFVACWQGTWADTNASPNSHDITVEHHPQVWTGCPPSYQFYCWANQSVVNLRSTTTYLTTGGAVYDSDFQHRAWTWHKDWTTGDAGNTSDGY